MLHIQFPKITLSSRNFGDCPWGSILSYPC